MATVVSTVYAFDMPKFIYIQLYASANGGDTPPPLKIRADTIEKKEAGGMVLKLGTETVGEFTGGIAGWWIQEEH